MLPGARIEGGGERFLGWYSNSGTFYLVDHKSVKKGENAINMKPVAFTGRLFEIKSVKGGR